MARRRATATSKNRRTVGGGVQRSERSTDAEIGTTMPATTGSAVIAGGSQTAAGGSQTAAGGSQTAAVATVANVNKRDYPLSRSELDGIKGFTLSYVRIVGDLNTLLMQKEEKIAELTKQVEHLRQQVNEAQQKLVKEDPVNMQPFTAVSAACSSGMADSSPTELPEQQGVKQKKRRKRNVALKQPNPDPLEPNETKRPRTRSAQAKSADTEKTQEVSLITADNEINKNITYDPTIHHQLIPKIVLEKVIINNDLGTYKVPGSSTIKQFRRYSN